jgi:hypothetical protein
VVNSTKSMTGHLLGGAGGIESVFTVLAVHHQVSPPTINLFNQDPECDLDYCANTAREMKIDVAVKNNFGFGGTNGTLVCAAPDRQCMRAAPPVMPRCGRAGLGAADQGVLHGLAAAVSAWAAGPCGCRCGTSPWLRAGVGCHGGLWAVAGRAGACGRGWSLRWDGPGLELQTAQAWPCCAW